MYVGYIPGGGGGTPLCGLNGDDRVWFSGCFVFNGVITFCLKQGIATWPNRQDKLTWLFIGLLKNEAYFNEENRGRNRHNVERFICAYYISAGQTSLLQVQWKFHIGTWSWTFQCKIFIVPEEGWFGQPKYSTHIKTFLRCAGFCLYFLHFIYVKPVRSPLIQRTPAGSSFRLLA